MFLSGRQVCGFGGFAPVDFDMLFCRCWIVLFFVDVVVNCMLVYQKRLNLNLLILISYQMLSENL